jgi:hypothetical protein
MLRSYIAPLRDCEYLASGCNQESYPNKSPYAKVNKILSPVDCFSAPALVPERDALQFF